MKVLVIGTGGREHALALALARDPAVTEVHAAPGNPGIGEVATLHDVDPMDGPTVAASPRRSASTWSSSGPRRPLVAGVADAVRAAGDRRASARPRPPPGSRGRRPSPRR